MIVSRQLCLVVAVLGICACDSANLQRDFEAEAGETPHGITRTDSGGRLILDADGTPVEVDSTDWQAGPLFIGSVRFDPAYPNPTSRELITLPFVVPFSSGLAGGLIVRGFTNTGRFVLLDEVPEADQTGAWTFIINPSLLSAAGDLGSVRGIHRLFVFDLQGRLATYGDIRIE